MTTPTLQFLGSIVTMAIDADVLCLIAREAIEQDKASTMTDALIVARTEVELLVARALNSAWSEAIERVVAPRSVEEIRAEQEAA